MNCVSSLFMDILVHGQSHSPFLKAKEEMGMDE